MFALTLLACILGPAAVLFGIYLAARRLDHPLWAYVSLVVDVAAGAAGLYIIGLAPLSVGADVSGSSLLIRYMLGIGLLIAGVRVGYESWKIRDTSEDEADAED